MTEIKLDLTEAKRCSRLCELSINYNAGVPTAVFTKTDKLNLKFVYSRVETKHDVVFLKKKYILTEFTIHDKIHKKGEDVYEGEIIFIHKNVADMSDILAISVFVKKTENNVASMCQDFFTQLSDGILKINNSGTYETLKTYLENNLTEKIIKRELVVNPYWSTRSVIQSGENHSFFFYKGRIPYASGISQDVT